MAGNQKLQGKRVFVLGGSSGMGRACAKAALEAGAHVTIASRSEAKLADAAREMGSKVITQQLDATDDAAVSAIFAKSQVWDHVICCAGAGGRGKIAELSLDDALAAMNGKFWAYYRVARAARIAKDGSLTFVSGQFGHRPQRETATIGAINAAIEGLSRGLAVDMGPVRVNTVCPGIVDTPQWDRMPEADRKAMYERVAAHLPVGRIGQSEDVAQAVLFVMTNPYTTGSVVILDGGAILA